MSLSEQQGVQPGTDRQTGEQRGIGRAVTGAGQEVLLFRSLFILLIFGLELL